MLLPYLIPQLYSNLGHPSASKTRKFYNKHLNKYIVTANTTGLQKLQRDHLDRALRHAEKAHKKTKRI